MGVDMFTVINWEKGRTAPPSRCMPALLKFLGYDPRPTPTTIGGKLTAWRESDGLTVREAARRLGIDEGTLGRWEAGETILLHKHRKMVAALIDSTLKDLHHQMAGRWMAVPGRGTDLARARAKSLEMRSCQAAPKARR
jgi:DNA-binding transcriptional regulator YiaG